MTLVAPAMAVMPDPDLAAGMSRLSKRLALEPLELGEQGCVEVSDQFGELVNQGRDLKVGKERLLSLRALGDQAHRSCRKVIRALEEETGEDERALESLYRSELWYQINRSLAAFRYWQAWADLLVAGHHDGDDEQVRWLSAAERGFQAAALRILYPGLVYGSWLGLAYVEQMRDEEDAATRRLRRLKEALSGDPDNPILELVDYELALVALRRGDSPVIEMDTGTELEPAQARLMEEQAMILLARHREQGVGALEAATYLKPLMNSRFLDDRLFERLLTFRDEIVGRDIGLTGLLVDAEFAYGYQQYETNVLKFREFKRLDGLALPLSWDQYRYHFAVSLFKIGLPRDALAEIDALLGAAEQSLELRRGATKLRFLVSDAMYLAQPDQANGERLLGAARAFLEISPADADVAFAHLALALLDDDVSTRQQHLARAGTDDRLRERVAAAGFDTAMADFRVQLGQADSAKPAARRTLLQLADLPRDQRDSPALRVISIQLRTVRGDAAEPLLEELDTLLADVNLDPRLQRTALWSRLRLLDRHTDSSALATYVDNLPAAGADALADNEVFSMLREVERRGDTDEVLQLTATWLPALDAQPQLHRQVWLMQVGALLNDGQLQTALRRAEDMVGVFPDSGDAWQALAEAAEVADEPFAAERAWAHIAAAEPVGSDRWLTTSLRRVEVLTEWRGAQAGNCELLQGMGEYRHRLATELRQQLDHWLQANDCQFQASEV
jgi:predicted Zn-dependent protease